MNTLIPLSTQQIYTDIQNSTVFSNTTINVVNTCVTNLTSIQSVLTANSQTDPTILSRIATLLDNRSGPFAIITEHLTLQYNSFTRNAMVFTSAINLQKNLGTQQPQDAINYTSNFFGSLTGSLTPFLSNATNAIALLGTTGNPYDSLTAIEDAGDSMTNIANNEVQAHISALNNQLQISQTANLLSLSTNIAMAPVLGSIAIGNLANTVQSLSTAAGVYSGLNPEPDLTTPVSNDSTPWIENNSNPINTGWFE